MRGKLISIEGIDGCGKSTHARLLTRWLRSRGREVVITDEPTNGAIGKVIKRILRGKLKMPISAEALLFAADRVEHVTKKIWPAISKGKIIITERYVASSLAYQAARGLPLGWLKIINERAPNADLTILIDVPEKVGIARVKRSRALDTFESDLRLQGRVRSNYLRLARQKGFNIVNGNRDVNEVQAEIRELVKKLL